MAVKELLKSVHTCQVITTRRSAVELEILVVIMFNCYVYQTTSV